MSRLYEKGPKPGWREITSAGNIPEGMSARRFKTGDWRSERPIWNAELCIHCLRCFIYCPDSSILTEGGKMTGIDYDHCKGCGICAFECPQTKKGKALTMLPESQCK